MLGIDIDSERKQNSVSTEGPLPLSTHCVLIMEQPAMSIDDAAPTWRVSVRLIIRDPILGQEDLEASLPAVIVGPILHHRQVVAVARYPSPVARWEWTFESDDGRARARVWLHPGQSERAVAGIFVLPTLQVQP
jgi:hypothetical protein